MLLYFVILTVLAMFSIICLFAPRVCRSAGLFCALALILFAGLRFETGYDWDAYGDFLNYLGSFWTLACQGYDKLPIDAEFLYLVLNQVVVQLGGSFSHLVFVVSAFSILSMSFVVQKISLSFPQVATCYFGICFLMGQFVMLRQALASGFVLLGLYFLGLNRLLCALLLMMVAVGFHVSALLYLPIFFLVYITPSVGVICVFIFIGLFLVLFRVPMYFYIVKFFIEVMPDWIAYKLHFYLRIPQSEISIGSFGILSLMVVILGLLLIKSDETERASRIFRIGVWVGFIQVCFHLYFFGMPMFWSRIILVSLPITLATIFGLAWYRVKPERDKLLIYLVALGISASSLFYFLNRPAALPFLPYFSHVHSFLGYKSDGKLRLEEVKKLGTLGGDRRSFGFDLSNDLIVSSPGGILPLVEYLPVGAQQVRRFYCE